MMDYLLRVSAIGSFISINQKCLENPNWSLEEVESALACSSYFGSILDFEASRALRNIVGDNLPEERSSAFRECIYRLIETYRPSWALVLASGRSVAAKVLHPDIIQCFEIAGAFSDFPSQEIVQWLDKLALIGFSIESASKVELGRFAERLSIDFEKRRLCEEGINRQVLWTSLNDNRAGYDVRSWMFNPSGEVVPKLIEVKGYVGDDPSFFITRHEWETARQMHSPYLFQIWHIPTKEVIELSVRDVMGHIPVDNGMGQWKLMRITLS